MSVNSRRISVLDQLINPVSPEAKTVTADIIELPPRVLKNMRIMPELVEYSDGTVYQVWMPLSRTLERLGADAETTVYSITINGKTCFAPLGSYKGIQELTDKAAETYCQIRDGIPNDYAEKLRASGKTIESWAATFPKEEGVLRKGNVFYMKRDRCLFGVVNPDTDRTALYIKRGDAAHRLAEEEMTRLCFHPGSCEEFDVSGHEACDFTELIKENSPSWMFQAFIEFDRFFLP